MHRSPKTISRSLIPLFHTSLVVDPQAISNQAASLEATGSTGRESGGAWFLQVFPGMFEFFLLIL